MKSVAVKKGYSAGATCLGEFLPLQMSNPLSRETNAVESKKRKHLLTEISVELDLEIGDEQNIDAALPKGPNNHIEAVLPQGPNHHIEAVLHQGPNHHIEAVLHQGPNHHIEAVLHQGPNHNQATPSSVLQGLNHATPSSVWPSDLITILQRIAATPCCQPSKPFFAFEFSLEAANKNFILLKRKFGGDLSKALPAQSNMPLGYGSKFKPIEMLELIFKNHPSWSRMKRILTHGSKWPLQPLDEEDRIKDVEEALNFENHKGAIKQQELLKKLVTNDVIRGFAIPLPLSKITQIPGILFAPLNIQAQNTINERGEIIPKNRLTHDQSWMWQSVTSVNSRINKDELMPCYFGRTMRRLLNWVVAAQKLYPNKGILATKLDVKAAYQRCHLNTAIAVQTCTQIPSEGLALLMLRLTFGGAPCPSEWGSIAESICDLANAILLNDKWNHVSLQLPAQHLVPNKIILDNNIPFGIGRDLVVDIPVDPRGTVDLCIEDFYDFC